jgi:hypothetical protein
VAEHLEDPALKKIVRKIHGFGRKLALEILQAILQVRWRLACRRITIVLTTLIRRRRIERKFIEFAPCSLPQEQRFS